MTDNKPAGVCPHCNVPTKAGARFCPKCGNRLNGAPAAAQPAGQAVPPAPAHPIPAAPAAPAAPGAAPTQPSTSAAPPPNPPPALAEAVEGVGAALSSAWQAVRGAARNLLSVGAEGGPVAPSGAQPGDYVLGVKPVSGKDSNIGNVRQVNEDSFVVLEVTRVQESRGIPLGLYVVADGMGGHKAGEIASRTVNKIITEKVLNAEVIPGLAFATRRLDETPGSVLASAVKEANRILYNLAHSRGSDMGTTLTAALIIGDTATIANVGDSRTYLWREGVLRQVTEDHSLVASLVKAGMLKPEEVRQHPQRNQVFRSLGTKPEVEPDIFTETLQRGDRLILCSDGLWEMVRDPEISRIVARARSPQEACRALIQKAKDAGGDDNITVIVVKME